MAPTKKSADNAAADESKAAVSDVTEAPATAKTNGSAPTPSTYELQDDYADDPLATVKAWVADNPAQAVAAAAGVGFIVGRLVTALFPEPEPPSLAERVEARAKKLRKDASHYADDAGEALSQKLKAAADALSDAAETAAEKAEAGYERSRDLADVVADAAKAAVAGAVAKKADSWLKRGR